MSPKRFVIALMFSGAAAGIVCMLMLLPELFFVVPWPIRKKAAGAIFLGFVGLAVIRLLTVRPADRTADPNGVLPSPRLWHHAIPWALAAIVGVMAWPLLDRIDGLAFGDWTYYGAKYEAARRSIVDYQQFPWWDPWTRGGFPLAANPLCGVFGVAMPLVLVFGTSIGLRLAVVACFLFAAEGTRRLALLWVADPVAAAAGGLIYAVNGGVLIASVAAFDVPMGYAVLPWMLYHVFRLNQSWSAGLWLGVWGAVNVLNGIAYFTIYIVLISAVAWIRVVREQTGPGRRMLLANTIVALGVSLALGGVRLTTTALVCLEFPRLHGGMHSTSPFKMLELMLFRPGPATLARETDPFFWESCWYYGPVVPLLLAASLHRGWRWWHTLALVCCALALGSTRWYEPSYWLVQFPFFSSMYVVRRWRFMAGLGIALAMSDVLAYWRSGDRGFRAALAHVAIAVIALDYLLYGFAILPVAFSIPPTENHFPGPPLPRGDFLQVRAFDGFAATCRGYGVVHGYEPLLGYDRGARTERLWCDSPLYRGEHWTDRGTINPVHWSPNRIVLQIDPGETVYVNQNPGSWWWLNGRPIEAFTSMRCVETTRVFAVQADEHGRAVLEIVPRGRWSGLAVHIAGAGLVGLIWFTRSFWTAAARADISGAGATPGQSSRSVYVR